MIAGEETVQQDDILGQPSGISKKLICQSAIIEHLGSSGRSFHIQAFTQTETPCRLFK